MDSNIGLIWGWNLLGGANNTVDQVAFHLDQYSQKLKTDSKLTFN